MSSQILDSEPLKAATKEDKNRRPGLLQITAVRVFRFFASLQLAIAVLLALMVILAAGTILESLHGAETARLVVYDSFWFSLVLVLLGINVAAAALDRIPWKLKHVGFVITHVGIIILLIGSLITQRRMIDGQMPVVEGQSESRITLTEPLLYAASHDEGRDWLLPVKKHAFVWHGREEIKSPSGSPFPFRLFLISDYPKARVQREIRPAEESGPAAVKVTLHNSFVNESQWLLEGDEELGEVQIGPAKVRFAEEFLKESGAPAPTQGYLEFEFGARRIQAPVSSDLKSGSEIDLEGTPYRAEILRVFKNAFVAGKELQEVPPSQAAKQGEQANPAVQLLLKKNDDPAFQERHTVFANFPDFPTRHGMKPSETGARIFYRLPNAGSKGETHELRFVEKEGKLFYQVQTGFDVKTGQAVNGEEIPTGWMDLKFRVEDYYPHARMEQNLTAMPNNSESQEAAPAFEIEIEKSGERKSLSLSQGARQSVRIAGTHYEFLYGQKRIPAPFQLQLRDFKIENYPGTDRPASFESDVVLKDPSRGVYREATISMNKPLIYRGFRIYQSGYNLSQGAPDVSIFSVGKDPGVPLKYAGALVMVAGILTMFYTRKFSTTSGRKL